MGELSPAVNQVRERLCAPPSAACCHDFVALVRPFGLPGFPGRAPRFPQRSHIATSNRSGMKIINLANRSLTVHMPSCPPLRDTATPRRWAWAVARDLLSRVAITLRLRRCGPLGLAGEFALARSKKIHAPVCPGARLAIGGELRGWHPFDAAIRRFRSTVTGTAKCRHVFVHRANLCLPLQSRSHGAAVHGPKTIRPGGRRYGALLS